MKPRHEHGEHDHAPPSTLVRVYMITPPPLPITTLVRVNMIMPSPLPTTTTT